MRIGRYDTFEMVGQGGMGTVYHGRAPEGVEVAIKVLRQPAGRATFDREIRLLGRLSEVEGFVPLIDMGECEAGPYLVMPFLTGGTLAARIQGRRLPVAEAVEIVLRLAEALGRAHALGIVHRDMKPENVLFAASDSRPLVADLGLAKHFRWTADGAAPSLTLTGAFKGTAGYMAPEQMEDAKTVGAPADVFALGAILYECLAGEPAFPGQSPMEIIDRVRSGRFEPLRSIRPDVPPWLEAIVIRAFRPDPADRFHDGAAMARTLARGGTPSRPARTVAVIATVMTVLGAILISARAAPRPAPTGVPSDEHLGSLGARAVEVAPRELLESVTRDWRDRAYVAAIERCEPVVARTRDPWAEALLAEAYLEAGWVEKALAMTEKWPTGTRGEARALAVRAFIHMNRRDEEPARVMAEARRALELDDTLPRAWLVKSLALLDESKDLEAARAAAAEALRRSPPCAGLARIVASRASPSMLGVPSRGQKDPEVILDPWGVNEGYLPAATADDWMGQKGEVPLLRAAWFHFVTNDSETAAAEAEEAIRINPYRPFPYALRAVTGHDVAASWAKAAELDSLDRKVAEHLIANEVRAGQWSGALALLERHARRFPRFGCELTRARLLVAGGRPAEAVAALASAVLDDARAYRRAALILLHAGRLDVAREHADRAVRDAELSRKNELDISALVRSRILLVSGEPTLARESIEKIQTGGAARDAALARAVIAEALSGLDVEAAVERAALGLAAPDEQALGAEWRSGWPALPVDLPD